MADRERPNFLRLVSDKGQAADKIYKYSAPLSSIEDDREAWQPTLFPELNPHLAVALDLDNISKANFVEIIERIHPRAIIDLRVIPRFDYDGFNRRTVFDFFSRIGSTYFDFTGDVGVKDDRDAKLNPAFVTTYVQTKVCKTKLVSGPLVFLIESHEGSEEYLPLLAHHLSGPAGNWQWVKAR